MANANPNIENLQRNRGRKPKIGRKEFSMKLLPEEKSRLEKIAKAFGLTHGDKGSISALLNSIANSALMVVETPPLQPLELKYNSEHPFPDDPDKTLDQSLVREICNPMYN